MAEVVKFTAIVDADGADAAEREELTRRLREDLLEVGVDEVEPQVAQPPPGAKAVDGAMLALSVSTVSVTVPALLNMLQTWVSQRRLRCILRLQGPNGETIEIPNVAVEEAQRVIERWGQATRTPDGSGQPE